MRGYLAYYAVTGNTDAVTSFRIQVTRPWHKALWRRSQRTRINWAPMNHLANRWLPIARVKHPFPDRRFAPVPEAGAQCGWQRTLGSAYGPPHKGGPYRDPTTDSTDQLPDARNAQPTVPHCAGSVSVSVGLPAACDIRPGDGKRVVHCK